MNPEFDDSMDAGLLQLERELSSLTPAGPSRLLAERLTEAVEGARSGPTGIESMPRATARPATVIPWRRVVLPTAAAAAAAVFVLPEASRRGMQPVAGDGGPPSRPDSNVAKAADPGIRWVPMPRRSEYRVVDNTGLVLTDEAAPLVEFRVRQMDHHEWRNPEENSSIQLSIPREQRVVLPASYR